MYYMKLKLVFLILISLSLLFSISSSALAEPTKCDSTQTNKMSMSTNMHSRLKGAIFGQAIGDALAMPVHWYYDRSRIFSDFGPKGIAKYEASVKSFPGSIMNLSNTGGGGRGTDKGEVIGSVILHGKKKYWMRGGSYHYHYGMKAGENTLDTLLSRLLVKTITTRLAHNKHAYKSSGDDDDLVHSYLEAYIALMTTPDSHNDVYAATAHRMFFKNYALQSKDMMESADNDGHNTDSIDGIINVIPLSLHACASGEIEEKEQQKAIYDVINAIRKSEHLPKVGIVYDKILTKTLKTGDLKASIESEVTTYMGSRVMDSIKHAATESSDPMTACYIDSSFPAMLLFAYKYGHDIEKCLLASANAGGENVNRGSVLGALLGAAHGYDAIKEKAPWMIEGLVAREEIEKEADAFLNSYPRLSHGQKL